MKKLMTLIAAAILGVSMIGCADNKPAAPAAKTEAPGPEAKPETPPAETPKADEAK